jgi:hypothetical protein
MTLGEVEVASLSSQCRYFFVIRRRVIIIVALPLLPSSLLVLVLVLVVANAIFIVVVFLLFFPVVVSPARLREAKTTPSPLQRQHHVVLELPQAFVGPRLALRPPIGDRRPLVDIVFRPSSSSRFPPPAAVLLVLPFSLAPPFAHFSAETRPTSRR